MTDRVSWDVATSYQVSGNAEALIDIGRAPQAVELLEQGLEQWPDNARLLEGLVRGLLVSGRPKDALTMAERLVAVAPNSWRSLLWLSRANRIAHHRPQQRLVLALPPAQRAVELAPGNARAHHEVGLVLLESTPTGWGTAAKERLGRAQDAAAEAIALAPNWTAAHYLAASVAMRLGDKAAAGGHAERALEVAPTDETAMWAVYETSNRMQRRRQIAARLAFSRPSGAATDLVASTHRASAGAGVALAVLGASAVIVGDLAIHGDLPETSSGVFWVAGPILGALLLMVAVMWRSRRLADWDPEIRSVVYLYEERWRWQRRACVVALGFLPLMWMPASLTGDRALIWAFSALFAGALPGFGWRFKLHADSSRRRPFSQL